MSAFFEVSSLGVSIGDTTIIKDIDLAFREGEVTALLGHNGSGKSTLLKALARQLTPARGEIRLLGQCGRKTDQREFARTVGTGEKQSGPAQAELQAGGHWYLDRGAGGAAESTDPDAGEFSCSVAAGPAYAGCLHQGVCRAPGQAVPDFRQGG